MTRNVFVVGLDESNRRKLNALRDGAGPPEEELAFHPLLDVSEVTATADFPLDERLARAETLVRQGKGAPDALLGYWDFPVSLMVALLCRTFRLPGPPFEAVLRCEHKYWSRLEQQEAAPEHVPPFRAVDPFDDEALAALDLDFPFWLKPVKSFGSHLGFRVRHRGDLRKAALAIRQGIGDLAGPFNDFLSRGRVPERVAEVDGFHCIAEGILSGSQCTLEGFVHQGRAEVYGVVDSIRHVNRSSFSRYQYPSRLPRPVQERMRDVARRVVERMELDDTAFNMELFWDARRDRIGVLEINPRMSQAHGDLFERVDGAPHHRVAVDLALGRRPHWTHGGGDFRRAGTFFLRSFRDARVDRVPTAREVRGVRETIPGTLVEVMVREGMLLSELDRQEQDSYSFTYGRAHLGAGSQRALMEGYRCLLRRLPFHFSDPDSGDRLPDPGVLGPHAGEALEEPVVPGQRPSAGRKRHVFFVGLNAFNRRKVERLEAARECVFHSLLDEPEDYELPKYLEQAERRLLAFEEPIDAVLGYMDFPVSTMLPILCRRFGLPSPTLESVLRCEHKYWSRLEQRKAIPEHVPEFAAFDPFDDASVAGIPLQYPYWVKPVKSAASHLGFRIRNRRDLARAVETIRKGIDALARPFNAALEHAQLPPEVEAVDGRWCMAEEIISGRQCTLEGWVFRGEVGGHGIVDSVRESNRSTFNRYEYPSLLPRKVKSRIHEAARRVLEQVGFDNSGFNMEFEWDRARDRLRLVEINTRVAQHHSDLFEKVDGATNHQVPLFIGLGRRPEMPHRQGKFRRAAAFFIRRFQDGVVTGVPDPATVEEVQRDIPGTVVQLQVGEGDRLSDLFEQDSYSYALALVYIGANNQRELLERYREAVIRLPFSIDPAP